MNDFSGIVGKVLGETVKAEDLQEWLDCSKHIIIKPGDSLPEMGEHDRCRIHVNSENKIEGISFG